MSNSGTTFASDLKGGDHIVLGGRVREVFDTYPCGYGATMVRYFARSGAVHQIRFYAAETVLRVPAECAR